MNIERIISAIVFSIINYSGQCVLDPKTLEVVPYESRLFDRLDTDFFTVSNAKKHLQKGNFKTVEEQARVALLLIDEEHKDVRYHISLEINNGHLIIRAVAYYSIDIY